MTKNEQPSLDDQMRLAVRAMAHHAGESWRTDRTGWTDEQWIEDAERLMDDVDGSVTSLVNGHVIALLRFWRQHRVPAPGKVPLPRRLCDLPAAPLTYFYDPRPDEEQEPWASLLALEPGSRVPVYDGSGRHVADAVLGERVSEKGGGLLFEAVARSTAEGSPDV